MNKQRLSEITGLSPRMIQFYTEEGIIPCCRLNTGRGKPRHYKEDFGFLLHIKAVKDLHDIGMSISKIKELQKNEYMLSAGYYAKKILKLNDNEHKQMLCVNCDAPRNGKYCNECGNILNTAMRII